MITNYKVTPEGVRLNPNVRPCHNIALQIAAHRAKSRKTTKQQIQDVLDN